MLVSLLLGTLILTTQPELKLADDLQQFRSDVLAVDRSFTPEQRAEADIQLSQIEAQLTDMSQAQFQLSLARVMNTSNNGHSVLLASGWANQFNSLPVNFLITSDGMYIAAAADHHSDLVGARVISINGHDQSVLESRWDDHQSSTLGWRRQFVYYFIESPELLHAAGLGDHSERAVLTIEQDGATRTIVLAAQPVEIRLRGIEAFLPPPRVIAISRDREAGQNPLYLQEPDRVFRWQWLADEAVLYIQYRANIDFSGQEDVEAFQAEVRQAITEHEPTRIILDQRFNLGGDLNITRSLMQFLPDAVGEDGRVFALVSGRTFSAGISSVGYLRQAGGDRVTIIGQPLGDSLNFWAEGDLVVLENTNAAFLYARERHNYVTGCPEDDCHGSIRHHPIRVDNLDPDYVVDLSWSDYLAGRDPWMDRALELSAQ
jgi:hypothetical protein